MRHNIAVSVIRLSILAVTLWCGTLDGSAQSRAFTYQGQLNDSGSPANGLYWMEFKLFDAATGGTQVGITNSISGVAVTNGLFTVTLSFGAPSFSGVALWLEISVKASGATTYTTLSPRQELTSAPYAIKSLNAVSADGLSAACVGCVSDTQIGSLPTSSGNYIQNTTTQQATSNFNISGNGVIGGKVGIGIQIPEQKLSVSGGLNIDQDNANNSVIRQNMLTFGSNSGEGIASKRTVTGNRFGLDFFTNNLIHMSISNAGNVGIGRPEPPTLPTLPLGRLQVITANDTTATNIPGWDARHFVVGGTSNTGGSGMSYDQTNGVGYIEALSPGVSFRNLILQFGGGNVGIGTTSPDKKLTIAGSIHITPDPDQNASPSGLIFPDTTTQTTAADLVATKPFGSKEIAPVGSSAISLGQIHIQPGFHLMMATAEIFNAADFLPPADNSREVVCSLSSPVNGAPSYKFKLDGSARIIQNWHWVVSAGFLGDDVGISCRASTGGTDRSWVFVFGFRLTAIRIQNLETQ